jgi:uncharacterized protein (DUF305 family)
MQSATLHPYATHYHHKTKNMIRKIGLIALIAATHTFVSCNNESSNTTESSKDTTTAQAPDVTQDTTKTADNNSTANGLMASMNSMMDRMKNMKMTGDFDIDFANMMIEHHQGAIDMSEQELSAGKNDTIKGMAQKIITKQKKEISDLQDFIKNYKPSGMKHGEGELQKSMSDMESKMKNMQMTGDTDKDFAMMMVQHHQDGIATSKREVANGMSAKLKQMAQKGITDQNKDIKEFQNWLASKK